MNRLLLTAALGFALAPAAHAGAPLIDVYAGVQSWDADISGDIASGGNDADVEGDLDFSSSRHNVFFVGLEHPVPLVPNARLRIGDISYSANGRVDDFEFDGVPFSDERVSSDLTIDYQDLTLYYTPFDLVFKLDFGLTIRRIDAELEVESRDNPAEASEDASAVFPMLHVAARGDLPLTGFYAAGELNAISYDGSRLSDVRAALGWQSDFLLAVEVGYSQLSIKLDDVSDLDADLSLGGPYLGLSLNF